MRPVKTYRRHPTISAKPTSTRREGNQPQVALPDNLGSIIAAWCFLNSRHNERLWGEHCAHACVWGVAARSWALFHKYSRCVAFIKGHSRTACFFVYHITEEAGSLEGLALSNGAVRPRTIPHFDQGHNAQ